LPFATKLDIIIHNENKITPRNWMSISNFGFWSWNAMFSQTVEYALRTMIYLADQAPYRVSTDAIARATKVPKPYLSKVIQGLIRAGLLESRRGVGGGVSLIASPGDITILQVVEAVDPIGRITTCPLGLESHGIHLCPLHRRLDDSLATVEDAFRRSTLAEILAEPTKSKPLCAFPAGTLPRS
jgi:Rrf2 family nitric oxide-sensitive transcriptional repressor